MHVGMAIAAVILVLHKLDASCCQIQDALHKSQCHQLFLAYLSPKAIRSSKTHQRTMWYDAIHVTTSVEGQVKQA